MTPPAAGGARSGTDPIPALIVADGGRRRLAVAGPWSQRLVFCDLVAELTRLLDQQPVTAILAETRDADGVPVLGAIRDWVGRNPRVPVIVWTAGSDSALREILDLSAAGGDVRLVLHPRDDLSDALERLLAMPALPHPGAVPALLRGVVLTAPPPIQPELTLAVYHAWPRPGVGAWADSLHLTRQALNRRLSAAGYGTASVVMDHFSAAEIAMRLTIGMRLRDIAAAMGRPDDRSLRRRLKLLRSRPEQLRDEADFRALIPRIGTGIRR
ncbi:MAG: hypothetical protein ACREMZ_05890 [Gemmatimonadales bacterium]